MWCLACWKRKGYKDNIHLSWECLFDPMVTSREFGVIENKALASYHTRSKAARGLQRSVPRKASLIVKGPVGRNWLHHCYEHSPYWGPYIRLKDCRRPHDQQSMEEWPLGLGKLHCFHPHSLIRSKTATRKYTDQLTSRATHIIQ